MTEEKFISGRGGKREGAGRPKGTTGAYKENKKKPCSFKLSEGEEQTTRAVLKDMRNDNEFNYLELVRLNTGFKPLILDLKEKYGDSIAVSIHLDTILIETNNEKIKNKMSEIIEKFIKWGENKLDEEYYVLLSAPAEIFSPYIKDTIYRWSIERKPKEDEENSSLA